MLSDIRLCSKRKTQKGRGKDGVKKIQKRRKERNIIIYERVKSILKHDSKQFKEIFQNAKLCKKPWMFLMMIFTTKFNKVQGRKNFGRQILTYICLQRNATCNEVMYCVFQ